MGTIDITQYDQTPSQMGDANQINSALSTIQAVINGGLENVNIKAAAGIDGAKIGLALAAHTPATVGWSGSPTRACQYVKLGAHVYAYTFFADGTSNSATTTLALPIACYGLLPTPSIVSIAGVLTAGACLSSGSTLEFYLLTGAMPSSGLKTVQGTVLLSF